ncbi:uncharacterized protein LOC105691313 [Athalia rosae]|uniref:uncharacterized protein LOC105691313 n=1 Tax=Athalia rosae TaxID=37344 RepID=UPI002034053B|nr:uncharacterized protein LOC105691313 [Athalia rosae]
MDHGFCGRCSETYGRRARIEKSRDRIFVKYLLFNTVILHNCELYDLPADNCKRNYEDKLKEIQHNLRSLDESLRESRALETEHTLRYSQTKVKNISLQVDLDKAKKRNKNMLSKFILYNGIIIINI